MTFVPYRECGLCLPEAEFDPTCLVHQPFATPPTRGQTLVHGERQATYGHPRENLTRIAGLWGALLGVQMTAEQVALMMVSLKVSRLWHLVNDDGLDDIDGYVEVIRALRADAPVQDRQSR